MEYYAVSIIDSVNEYFFAKNRLINWSRFVLFSHLTHIISNITSNGNKIIFFVNTASKSKS